MFPTETLEITSGLFAVEHFAGANVAASCGSINPTVAMEIVESATVPGKGYRKAYTVINPASTAGSCTARATKSRGFRR